MTHEELLTLVSEIGTCEDPAERRAKLTQVTDEINLIHNSNEELTSSKTKLEADNKKLQEYNMQLFLKVGGQRDPNKKDNEETGTENLTYENLFNDKGELK